MTDTTIPKLRLEHIGTFITEHTEQIICAWEIQSREEHPEASDEQRAELRNSLPDFLKAFGENLSDGEPEIPRDFAIEHGLQRWKIGWDVESLTRDFLILRRVLIRHLREGVDLQPDTAIAVAATMDEAVAVSVNAYVKNRELEADRQNEALRRKNYELKRFAHMVSHEVRNPLNMMSLAASALQGMFGDTEEARDHFALLREGRETIVEVLDNLLSYAALEIDDDVADEQVNLNEMVETSVHHLQYLIEATDAVIDADELPTIRGNHVSLRSVFENLIENAIKYAGEARPRIRITAEEDDACCTIRFTDNGIGIKEEDQPQVFRFLSRLNSVSDIPGSGVGLAMCRRIAEQHEGTLTLESTPGQGSTFILCLPKDGPNGPNADACAEG